MARDPRIVEVRHESQDDYPETDAAGRLRWKPSLWADLADGYNFEGCSAIHAYSVKGLYADLSAVVKGETY